MIQTMTSPMAPPALGPYSHATKVGNLIFLSGQIAIDTKTGEIVSGGIEEQTHQVFANIKAVLASAGCQLNKVIRTTVYMKNISEFSAMNKVYANYFADHLPARSTLEVSGLPKNAKIEIEVIAEID